MKLPTCQIPCCVKELKCKKTVIIWITLFWLFWLCFKITLFWKPKHYFCLFHKQMAFELNFTFKKKGDLVGLSLISFPINSAYCCAWIPYQRNNLYRRCYHLHFSDKETELQRITQASPETWICYTLKTMYCDEDVLLKAAMKNSIFMT